MHTDVEVACRICLMQMQGAAGIQQMGRYIASITRMTADKLKEMDLPVECFAQVIQTIMLLHQTQFTAVAKCVLNYNRVLLKDALALTVMFLGDRPLDTMLISWQCTELYIR